MLRFVFCFFVMFFNSYIYALTLEDALVVAYSKNSELQIIRNNFLNEIEQFSQAFSTFLPRISYNINYTNNKNKYDSKYHRSPSREFDSKQGNLILEQPLFSGGSSVFSLKAAQFSFKSSASKYSSEEQKIFLTLIQIYLDCYELQEKFHISQISVDINKEQLNSIEAKLSLGEATLVDLSTAKASLATAESNKLAIYAEYQSKKAMFSRSFGLDGSNLSMPYSPLEGTESEEAFIKKALEFNPNIINKKNTIKAFQAAELAAKGQLLPTATLRVQTGKNYFGTEMPAMNQLNNRTRTTILSVNIPIYPQGGAEYSRIRVAKNNTRNSMIQFDSMIREVKAGIISSYKRLEAAKHRVIATQEAVNAAEMAYSGTVEEELVGTKTILDVLSSEEKLYNAKISKVNAEKELIFCAYQLKSLVGELTAKNFQLKVNYFSPEKEFQSFKKKLFIGL